MSTFETLIDLFRQSGRKITPQRRAILELLVHEDAHPSAEEIYQRITKTMPDISLATVYNTLHELVALGGLVEVQDLNENRLRYDTNVNTHHHLFCTRCHALLDIHHDFAALELTPEETAGFKILKHQVTFYGICPECLEHETN